MFSSTLVVAISAEFSIGRKSEFYFALLTCIKIDCDELLTYSNETF